MFTFYLDIDNEADKVLKRFPYLMKRLLLPLLSVIAIPNAINANSMVNDSLNAADINFNVGNKQMACTMVSMAILAANSPEIYGATSSSLKREVKNYANRCDLRF